MTACTLGNLELVRYLITCLDAKFDFKSNQGTPFSKAVLSGSIMLVEYLLGLGVDVNQTDMSGISPLYVAVYTGNIQMVKLLLEKNADPWIKGHN